MIPEVQAKLSFSKQTAAAFGGIRQERAGAFPLIAEAQNLSPDAAPFLAPRERRATLTGLPGEVQAIFPYQNGFAVLTDDGGRFLLYFPVSGGVHALEFEDMTYLTEYDPSAVWFGTQLFFPAFRFAADVGKRKVRLFDKSSDAVSSEYTQNSDGETELTLTLDIDADEYRVGEHVVLHASAGGKTGSYILPVDAVFDEGQNIRFRGDNLPPRNIFEGGEFYLTRDIPYCKRFATCQNRLWGWDGGDTLYASAPGNPMSFLSPGDIPEGERGLVFYPEASGRILTLTSFAGQPVCFTERSVILVAGDTPAEYHSVVCEKYGLAEDAEKTIATVGNSLFFCSDKGVCRYSGRDTELVFSVPCFDGACACGIGTKYVLWNGNYRIYIYDTQTGILTEETVGDYLIALAASGTGAYGLGSANGQNAAFVTCLYGRFPADLSRNWKPEDGYTLKEEEVVDSTVTFYPYALPDERISACSVTVDADLEEGAVLTLLAGYDNEAPAPVGRLTGAAKRCRMEIPVPPRRCERLTLSLSGSGAYRVYALSIRRRTC